MNLDKFVTVRFWDASTQEVFEQTVSLESLVENPRSANMGDVGFHLLNVIREEKGLPPIPEERYVK